MILSGLTAIPKCLLIISVSNFNKPINTLPVAMPRGCSHQREEVGGGGGGGGAGSGRWKVERLGEWQELGERGRVEVEAATLLGPCHNSHLQRSCEDSDRASCALTNTTSPPRVNCDGDDEGTKHRPWTSRVPIQTFQ